MIAVGCGGGAGSGDALPGGGGGGGGGGTATVALQLTDANGAVIDPPALGGTQTASVVVTAKNADGSAAAGRLVSVSGEAVTFTPASGQQLTDTSGVARFQVQSSDPFAGGATIIAADVTDVGQGQLAVALGGASATLGTLTPSSTTVAAYATIQVSLPVMLQGGTQPAAQLPVTFSASCGSFDPAQAITNTQGVAVSTYRNQSGTTACSGEVTLTAQVGGDTTTAQVTATAPTAANIQFVGASPARIYLAGSPGVGQSIVRFKLVDSSGNPVAGEAIDLLLSLLPNGTYLGATPGQTSMRQSTAADGTVSVAVNAGSAPGPVQVQATLVSDPSIKNVSNALAVASGLPVQKAFSLSVSTFNIEAWETDGVPTTITLRMADRLGNPVPDGTTVNFIAEGGQVVASCNSAGAAANGTSECTVTLSSQDPRPLDGRVTVLAWAQGEETFVDSGSPTNNIYDAGEAFTDLGQPFLDKDETGTYSGDDVTVGTASGSTACPPDLLSRPDTCNGTWAGGALVRAQAVITFSGSEAFVTFGTAVAQTGGRCAVPFTLTDLHGNPMPAGSTLTVGGISGGGPTAATFAGFSGAGNPVPNTSDVTKTSHAAVFANCPTPASLAFQLTVTTPKARSTTVFFP